MKELKIRGATLKVAVKVDLDDLTIPQLNYLFTGICSSLENHGAFGKMWTVPKDALHVNVLEVIDDPEPEDDDPNSQLSLAIDHPPCTRGAPENVGIPEHSERCVGDREVSSRYGSVTEEGVGQSHQR